jgi:hypothetical protein
MSHLLFEGSFEKTRVRSVTRQPVHRKKVNARHTQQQKNLKNSAPLAHINKIPPISGDGFRHADSNAVTCAIPSRAQL